MKNIFSKNKKILFLQISIIICFFISVCFLIYFGFIRTQNVNTQAEQFSSDSEISDNSNLSEEPIVAELSNDTDEDNSEISIDELEDDQEIVTDDEKKNSTSSSKSVSGNAPYFIRINYTANVVTIYKKDSDGNYTIPFKSMVCSCGTATPHAGTYTISSRYRWLKLFGDVYGQYSTRIVNHILFHSVPYLDKSPDSLEYWEYDKLGTTASAGCIRLTVADAKWIYDNCSSGTKVEFYSSSNPGPLGKPSARKISSNVECRNWDPTDSNSNNPWRNVKENSESSAVVSTGNNTTGNITQNVGQDTTQNNITQGAEQGGTSQGDSQNSTDSETSQNGSQDSTDSGNSQTGSQGSTESGDSQSPSQGSNDGENSQGGSQGSTENGNSQDSSEDSTKENTSQDLSGD